ncbi:hypothetical protein [Candidatus Chrysopegis kryptomonas]|uniref:NnrS protein n=1 Tax=Candidatus Chryseopegocella kryptomonas TaxID=1633643 RepID=A0A0P1MU43_9BACT|nr:hypothetical protein [Candidatus Chrysopegis kryptomonas]CUS99586.1 hypothetical protein JGI23_00687 [Candidatus Chrysopegis kryptomonas]
MERNILRGSMLIGILSFVLAVVLGVWRIALTRGFELPSIPDIFPPHGNLMVGAFLGTLIIFERMFALPVKWLLWVPYIWGLSAIAIHTDLIYFKVLSLLALLGWGIHRFIAYRTFKHFGIPLIEFLSYVVLSVALFNQNGLAGSVESALAGLSFAIAVIGVERIELTLSSEKKSAKIVYALLIVYLLVLVLNLSFYNLPIQIFGFMLIFVALGMIYNDPVVISAFRRSRLPQTPLHKFSRETLFVGYFWLFLGGLFLIFWDFMPMQKDVVYHSIGLGFIFTMILSHAPVVLGSTLSKMPKKSPSRFLFYAFQSMTLIRILADIFVSNFVELWMWSGWITGTLHFVIFIAYILTVLKSFS